MQSKKWRNIHNYSSWKCIYFGGYLQRKCLLWGRALREYVFANAHTGADGVLAIAKFLEIITKKGKLSELRKNMLRIQLQGEIYL